MSKKENTNQEIQAVQPFTMQGDILAFKPIPCMQYDTEIKVFVTNIRYIEEEKIRKGRTEFEPDTAYIAKWYEIEGFIMDKQISEKGDSVKFNLNTATAKTLIDDAQDSRSRLMSAVFTADKRDYIVTNEDGTTTEKTAVYPKLDKYRFLDCFDSVKAEKVIKGGK